MANINPRNISPAKQLQVTRLLKVRAESEFLDHAVPYFYFSSSVWLELWPMAKDKDSFPTYNLLLAWTFILKILMYPHGHRSACAKTMIKLQLLTIDKKPGVLCLCISLSIF